MEVRSRHTVGDGKEEPEGDDLAEVEELRAASGFEFMELAMNGQESLDPEVESGDTRQ